MTHKVFAKDQTLIIEGSTGKPIFLLRLQWIICGDYIYTKWRAMEINLTLSPLVVDFVGRPGCTQACNQTIMRP